MAKYVQGGVQTLIEPFDYITRVIGFTLDEAEAIIEATVADQGSVDTLGITAEEEDEKEESTSAETE